jgi:acyl-coenzyme A synthetase/AMP-(fatty) acid ligase
LNSATPLLTRDLSANIILTGTGAVSAGLFLAQVEQLAGRLPARARAINLCRQRYHFLLAFCAVILRGQCNLLPPNRQPATQRALLERYQDVYVIHDGTETATAAELEAFAMPTPDASLVPSKQVPVIAPDQICAITFTSGTTGESNALIKYWRTLHQGALVNHRYIFAGQEQNTCLWSLLATVPSQHMYGLETAVMLPLHSNVAVYDGQPLLPYDIWAALQSMPLPRLLVSTPMHLRALLQSGLSFPPAAIILSATAPLQQPLALQVEQRLSGELREIYGCSEAGSIAIRRTARETRWQAFDVFGFGEDGAGWRIDAAHLAASYELQDNLRFDDAAAGHFILDGRRSDIVNVAGKRGSLQELNAILLAIPGIRDGVVFEPEPHNDIGRLAALVVAPQLSIRSIHDAFRRHVDPVFIPRAIHFVDALPRAETGKLTRAAVLELFSKAGKPAGSGD